MVLCLIFLPIPVLFLVIGVKNLLFPSLILQARPDGIRFFGGKRKRPEVFVPWKLILSVSACHIHEEGNSNGIGLRIACHDSVDLSRNQVIDAQTEFTGPDNSEFLLSRGYLPDAPEKVASDLAELKARYLAK